ncbi:CWC16 protein [Calycina marina]|uniref:CWC16 protein n=1 Tax=Calycina marina TaxID=1763456 RepID=A0A9P7YXX9_9HELO|nr:CWC16 protein [Calycina marina]
MQGFNMGRYVPPDQEGLMSGNQLHGKHALGARANKICQGILTVRFEMPYPIWCTHCPKPMIIGQGVRFNAEKKKVGNYFSSPIYSFRMKHVACGGWIEIRTDPKNTAYIVTEGARKRDTGQNKIEEGDIKILTTEERDELRNNAFAALEGKVEDKARLAYGKRRLAELEALSEKLWDDPYEQNKRLRKTFREGRHVREKDAAVTGALQDKMSLGLDLLPLSKDDEMRAKLIEFGEPDPERALSKAISKPLFVQRGPCKPTNEQKPSRTKKCQTEDLAKKKLASVVADIRGNTRAGMDPFLVTSSKSSHKPSLVGVKSKPTGPDTTDVPPAPLPLVDYESE